MAFGIFQYDLQFFRTDPDYFLERRWEKFEAALGKCLQELRAAMRRMGIAGRQTLSDLEKVHVAIAYNAGSFRPAKGLRQGHFDGTKFYGELLFDFLRVSQTVPSPSVPALIAAPTAGSAAMSPPTPLAAGGATLQVDVDQSPLRLRSEPKVDASKPAANVIAHLPAGHRVRLIAGRPGDQFLEVETSLNGAHLRGFAASRFLVPVSGDATIPVVEPASLPPGSGIAEVFAPRKPGAVTRRTGLANALSLNETAQPGRAGTSPEELRAELGVIIEYLAVDKSSHARYQPRAGFTFCNIYAHDYCHLAGVYLPRVWWTPDVIARLAQGGQVEPRIGATIDEQRANDLFRWLRAFGPRFGWRQTGTLSKLQTEADAGAVALIVAARKNDGRPGHITVVVPETAAERARRNNAGEVVAALQSQAGRSNFRYGTGAANWWRSEQFAESAFWVHA